MSRSDSTYRTWLQTLRAIRISRTGCNAIMHCGYSYRSAAKKLRLAHLPKQFIAFLNLCLYLPLSLKLRLKKKEERRILRGHPWVFSNELQGIPAGTMPGEIVDVLDFSGAFIGRGYINPHSLICVRLLTRKQEEIDQDFFRGRIARARSLRTLLGFGDSYRSSARATAFPD
jgi:hypothetical protein